MMVEINNFKIGDWFYYFEESDDFGRLTIKKAPVENFDDKYINICDCSECKKRIGTDTEHYKYDRAIQIENAYFKKEDIEKELNKLIELVKKQLL